MVGALGQSASPRLAYYYAERDRRAFCQLLIKLVAIGAGIGVVGLGAAFVAGRAILTIIYKPEYADYADLFVWLMVAAMVSYMASLLGYGMTAARKFREQSFLFVAVSVVTCTGCAFFIPSFGPRGGAWTCVMSSVVQFLASALVIGAAVAIPESHSRIQSEA